MEGFVVAFFISSQLAQFLEVSQSLMAQVSEYRLQRGWCCTTNSKLMFY